MDLCDRISRHTSAYHQHGCYMLSRAEHPCSLLLLSHFWRRRLLFGLHLWFVLYMSTFLLLTSAFAYCNTTIFAGLQIFIYGQCSDICPKPRGNVCGFGHEVKVLYDPTHLMRGYLHALLPDHSMTGGFLCNLFACACTLVPQPACG